MQGDGAQAAEHARRAWDGVPASRTQTLGQAGGFLAVALQMAGQSEAVAECSAPVAPQPSTGTPSRERV